MLLLVLAPGVAPPRLPGSDEPVPLPPEQAQAELPWSTP